MTDKMHLARPRTPSQIDLEEALRFAKTKPVRAPETSKLSFTAVSIDAIGPPLDAVPRRSAAPADTHGLSPDAERVLVRIDGKTTVERLLATLDLRPEALFVALAELRSREIVYVGDAEP